LVEFGGVGEDEREVAVDGWEFGWSGVARLTELLLIKDVEVNFGDEDFLAQLADGGQFGWICPNWAMVAPLSWARAERPGWRYDGD